MIKYISLGSWLLALAFICGCRSQKAVTKADTSAIDSTSMTKVDSTVNTLRSQLSTFNISFDTLEISVARQADTSATAPEIFRLRAVGGSVVRDTRRHNLAIEGYNRLDSVAFRHSSSVSLAEHTATTAVASPANATAVVIIISICVFLLAAIWLYLRQK